MEENDETLMLHKSDYENVPVVGDLKVTGSRGNYMFEWTFNYSRVLHNRHFRCDFRRVDFDDLFLYGLCIKNKTDSIALYVSRVSPDFFPMPKMFLKEVDAEVIMSSTTASYWTKLHIICRHAYKRVQFNTQQILQTMYGSSCKIQCKISAEYKEKYMPVNELLYVGVPLHIYTTTSTEEKLGVYKLAVDNTCAKLENYLRNVLINFLDRRATLRFLKSLERHRTTKLFRHALEFFVFFFKDIITTDLWRYFEVYDIDFCNMLVEEGSTKEGNTLVPLLKSDLKADDIVPFTD